MKKLDKAQFLDGYHTVKRDLISEFNRSLAEPQKVPKYENNIFSFNGSKIVNPQS